SHVHVVVGETKHPMLEEHFIEWITLNTNQGIYRKQLNPGQEPVADFFHVQRYIRHQGGLK
ncbi:MAG: desulfoferrodoxin family protein, partial [Roseburia inulinivorans]|nr:desulfoferrodoxin family protein [Roseburia inulinivorans]